MSGMLQDKVILLTGAAGGIGAAAAELFAKEGAKLAIAGRTAQSAEPAAEKARKAGAETIAVGADLASPEQIIEMVEKTVGHFGRLDGAFNNAGITGGQIGQGGKKTAEWEDEAFEQILRVNLLGTWRCMKAQIPHMEENGGAIVNTTSLAALTGFETTAGYTASKHGLIGLTKTAALEYAPTIRINALCPGYVDTDMIKDSMSRRGDFILSKIPYGRLAEPVEMAELACWLLSDRASYATGAAFIADGGYMAG